MGNLSPVSNHWLNALPKSARPVGAAPPKPPKPARKPAKPSLYKGKPRFIGRYVESNPTVDHIRVFVPCAVKDRLKEMAVAGGRSMSDLVAQFIEDALGPPLQKEQS